MLRRFPLSKFNPSDIRNSVVRPVNIHDEALIGSIGLEIGGPDVSERSSTPIPVLHFQWFNIEMMFLDEEFDTIDFINKNFPNAIIHEAIRNKLFVHVVRIKDGQLKINHAYMCNFRRYGWAESVFPNTGFSGIIYGNGNDGKLDCVTPEQVIRDTFIVCIERSRVPDRIKNDAAVRPLYKLLLEDAIANFNSLINPDAVKAEISRMLVPNNKAANFAEVPLGPHFISNGLYINGKKSEVITI